MQFFAFVLFTPDEWVMHEDDMNTAVRERLLRFADWPQLDMPEYRPACWCMGKNASRVNSVAFLCRNATNIDPEFWTQLGLGANPPDPNCQTCGGSGRQHRTLSLNPEAKCDYWGMRSFSAWLDPALDWDTAEPDFGPVSGILAAIDRNEHSPLDEKSPPLPFAIVLPNLLWFELDDGANDAWDLTARGLLEQNRECMVAVVSLHS